MPTIDSRLDSADPRASLLAQLARYRDDHPDEAAVAETFRAFVEAHDDAMLRSCAPGHVTGSAFVVEHGFSQTLLVHHRKLDKWLQPGGHCEPGETTLRAALREALEETGVAAAETRGLLFDIDIHPIPARADAPAHYHYDARWLLMAEPGATEVSHESRAAEWVSLDEAALRNPEPSISRMVAKVLAIAKVLAVASPDRAERPTTPGSA